MLLEDETRRSEPALRKHATETTAPTWATRLGAWLDTESARSVRRSNRRAPRGPGFDFLDLDSSTLRYRVHGTGTRTFVFAADPPIVLEHYDALVETLAPHARVIAFEVPGYGFSPAKRGFDFSFEGTVKAVVELLEHLSVKDATLCFPCVSAYVAAAIAHARPDLVQSLVLAQAPSFDGALAWKRSRDPKRILARPVIGQLAMHALKKKRAPQWFAAAMSDSPERARMQHVAEAMLSRGSRWSLASAFQLFLVEGAAPPPVEQPIVALWGMRDRSHARARRESSRELGRDVRLVEWDDVGHFPDLEAPGRFADTILRMR
jgi:pimeloyl-ACP methyl ester carboxylesterase